ncbi:Rieske (2Fe-2S) protein [Vulcanisaeta sp. JCM 14467]|uniref:Rieske (2Fe-2S) protein n=1 Tax=Vulcanisaeta sp. JCM 14467 TaxID=1295370 RepID=UPI0006CFCF69|nr:Rieske (2Fe-2S) protein [Vulcanisaeta sp. JCM 14467]
MWRRVSILVKVFERRNSVITWVDGKPILIVKYGDNYYGMHAVCAHMGCALLTDVNGYIATCPAHLAKYDVRTGEMIEKPQVRPDTPCEYADIKTPLPTYRVRVTQDGFLEVDV